MIAIFQVCFWFVFHEETLKPWSMASTAAPYINYSSISADVESTMELQVPY
jgi:hypothetical protein